MPTELSPERAARAAEAEKRQEQYRREWAEINQALRNNSLAVTAHRAAQTAPLRVLSSCSQQIIH
jgi:hypothetical protein